MFFAVRIASIAGLGALFLLPFWAANRTVDLLFAQQGRSHLASANAMQKLGDDVLSRLHGVRTEIQADICSRGEQHYCFGGLCLPPPAAQSCARK